MYGDLSVDENIEFFAEIHNVRNYEARRNELLDFTRLTPFRKRSAEKLSGGMKQKLALACSLIHKPDIIFLDEPTTNLDQKGKGVYKLLFNRFKTGKLIVVASNEPYEIELCEHQINIEDYKIKHL